MLDENSAIEYSAEGADGNQYGIIREGSKYYIKVCKDLEKKNLVEGYDYIHGITSKKENEHKSYNEATKHFELKMMSLNEAYGGNKNASTIDFKREEKVFANLTEEARKELDRMHMILENSMTIGAKNTGNPEAPKTANFTPSIGKPFEEKAEAELDKDFKKTANDHEKQGMPFEKEVNVTDADMESDKAPKGGEAMDDMKDAEYVPEDAVAAMKPQGGKVVKVNESDEIMPEDEDVIKEDDMVGFNDEELSDEGIDALLSDDGSFYGEEPFAEDEFEYVPEDEEEFEPIVDDEREVAFESKKSLKTIVESVCDDVMTAITAQKKQKKSVNEAFTDMLSKIIKEEITKLDVFGKHPGYRKKPMTTPANTEVIKTKGDRDFNDDSVKGEKPFGSQIGKSDPFTEKVAVLTDAVMKAIAEGLKKK